MKFQLLLALALVSSCAVPALAAAGDCTTEDYPKMAKPDTLSAKCKTCLAAAGDKAMGCFPQDTKCKPAELKVLTDGMTKCNEEKDEAKKAKCMTDAMATLSADCSICMGVNGDAAMAKCFPAAAGQKCATKDLDTMMVEGPKCDALPEKEQGACGAAMMGKLSADCVACAIAAGDAGPSKCFDKEEVKSKANKMCCDDAASADLTKAGVADNCFAGVGAYTPLMDAAAQKKGGDAGCGDFKKGADVTVKCKAFVLSADGIGACAKKAAADDAKSGESAATGLKPAITIAALAVVATMAFAM